MFSPTRSVDETEDAADSRSLSSSALLMLLIISFLYFFSFSDGTVKDDNPRVMKVDPNADDSTVYYHNKTYVHPSFSLPQISLRLLNEANIHIESSSLLNVETDYVLSWKYKEDSRIHFKPFNTNNGLIAISVCKSSSADEGDDRKFTYFGLIRADLKLCHSLNCTSWSCQRDYDNFNKSYDAKHCILVLKSSKLNEILQFTHDFLKADAIPKTDLEVGMFCGNPLIARSANKDKEVYFVNFNKDSDDGGSPFFICKFSWVMKDVVECFNTEVVSSKLNMPLMLIHDPTTEVLMTANYNPENRNLNLLTFHSDRLSFKALFRSIPSPSGWIINLGSNSKGKVFFAGDSAPYEVLGVYDTATSKEQYHNLYL